MTDTGNILIIISLAVLVYVYLLYPVILTFIKPIFKKKLNLSTEYEPEITVLIPFYNEEKMIKDAVLSVYENGYPVDKINVIAASDGSSDKGPEIVRELQKTYKTLELIEFERMGKNAVLNMITPNINTELIFFLDSDSRPEKGAIKKMVRIFSDKKVGAVLSSLKYINQFGEDTGGKGEKLYQAFESWIRINESAISATVNSVGNFYAVRKKYYKPLPNDLIADDFQPLLNVIEEGRRIIFDTDIVINEIRGKSLTDEYGRRVRSSAAGWSSMWYAKKLLLPAKGWPAFFLWSHKVLRWMSPVFLILLFAGSVLSGWNGIIGKTAIIMQLLLYCLGGTGLMLEKMKINIFVFKMFLFFITMNLGLLAGFLRFISGRQNARWEGHPTI